MELPPVLRDGGAARPPTPVPTPTPARPGSGCRTFTGRVSFPNGTHPVPGALVYVPVGDALPPRTGECGQCVEPSAVAASAVTGPDGTFRLQGVPEGAVTVVVEKGSFQRVTPIAAGACGESTLDPEWTRLPRHSGEGSVPRIAVITGAFDAMELVLAKLGLATLDTAGFVVPGSAQFDLFDGGELYGDPWAPPTGAYPSAMTLLGDAAMLASYDYVFVNCGTAIDDPPHDALGNATIRANLRSFVERGGRLFVTDLSYDFVEQVFPPYVGFVGTTGDGLSAAPEPGDVAELGVEAPLTRATVHDGTLLAWLGGLGLLESDGSLRVEGLVDHWAVMWTYDEASTRVWLSGHVAWGEWGAESTGVAPLTVTFAHGCGRVLYTSYHTVESNRAGTLNAQELVLAYLGLEIGECLVVPEPPPEIF